MQFQDYTPGHCDTAVKQLFVILCILNLPLTDSMCCIVCSLGTSSLVLAMF